MRRSEGRRRHASDGRSREGSRRHGRRRVRSDRPPRAAGSRQLRPVGPQARRAAGTGADVDSRDQGGRHRPGGGGERSARLPCARRNRPGTRQRVRNASRSGAADQQRGRSRRRRHERRGRARHRVDEADLDADEAAPIRRPHDHGRSGRGHRAKRRVRRACGIGRRRGDGVPRPWRPRFWRSSAPTRSGKSTPPGAGTPRRSPNGSRR